jgi:SAM-dependent methyltransferase
MSVEALDSWREQLAAWAIPDRVLAAAKESPWVMPRGVFTRRTDRRIADPDGVSYREALEALGDRGSVLDVGAGAGSASLPLGTHLTGVTAVDTDDALLDAFAARAAALGVPVRLVCGRWPDVAAEVEPADVVVCAHVFYNVPDLGPFAAALTAHARRRVVVELTRRHPLTSLNPLWERLHGITRPEGPTVDDAIAALAEIGVRPRVTRWSRPAEPAYESFDDLVDVTRRRLCLPTEAAADVRAALLDLGATERGLPDLGSSGRHVATLSWAGTG